jgi:hypothetical protein
MCTAQFTNSLVELPKSKWRWDRFCFYASLVRCFSFDAEVENDISREFWAALCSATDASHPLLPGISKLSWSPKEHPDEPLQEGLSQLQLFLHPDLRDLTLHVPLDVMDLVFFSDIVREYAQLIRRRSPNLVKQMHQPASIAEREVTDLLRGLPVLESVCLPAYWGTASVLAELASRPTIKRIHAVSATDSGWGKAEDVMNVQPSLSEEPFHALTHLGLCLRFADWLSLLPRLTGPPLVELFVQLPELFQASSELSTFLDGLSTYQTTLPSLALELRDTQLIPSRSPRVGLSDLMPLHRLHKLEHFELYTGLPLLLTNEELATLLSGLPQLKTLRLSPEPLDDQDDPPYLMNRGLGILTLEALNVVRRSCPNMEVLSLYTSFWDIEDYEERNYDLQAPLKLVEYNMGTSTLRDDQAETVASLLFNFLPHSCQLEWGYYFPGDTVTVDWDRLEARFEKACELVGRMLNVVSTAPFFFHVQGHSSSSHRDPSCARSCVAKLENNSAKCVS